MTGDTDGYGREPRTVSIVLPLSAQSEWPKSVFIQSDFIFYVGHCSIIFFSHSYRASLCVQSFCCSLQQYEKGSVCLTLHSGKVQPLHNGCTRIRGLVKYRYGDTCDTGTNLNPRNGGHIAHFTSPWLWWHGHSARDLDGYHMRKKGRTESNCAFIGDRPNANRVRKQLNH